MVHGSTAHEVLAVVFQVRGVTEQVTKGRHTAKPQLNVLLWQRALDPEKGKWSLPGGRLQDDEDLTNSVRRQLAEKVDLREIAHLEQLAVFSDPHRVPGVRTIASTFLGLVPSPATPALPLLDQLRVVAGARSLLAFVAFGAVWAFAANCFGPFYHVFMFDQLGFSAFDVGVFLTLAQLGGALSLPAWGRLLDRYGNKPVMTFSLVLWQAQYLVWCFITPENSGWLYFLWTWAGTTSAGFVLGQFMILLRIVPLEARSLAIGVNLATISLVAAVAPVTGGWILSRALARGLDVFVVYHWCFLVQPVLALASCLLLRRVHEPLASPITMLLGAMRNIRTLSGVLGLDFLVNYVFYRPTKR